ncbi:MAG TPA: carboxypeptidase regulatory-like domain-containing protein [Pyrinomonadaceae bacterium]|jgi:tetratricopeptide (TPR) repeat protein
MRLGKGTFSKFVVLSLVACGVWLSAPKVFASSITGVVYDNRNNALPDVDLELTDEQYSTGTRRARTDGSGRYTFDGLRDSRYSIRVMPFRYDFIEQIQTVEIGTLTSRGVGGGTAFEIRDFYLQPRKGSLEEAEASVLFAQEIPKDARKAYEKALNDFSKKRKDEGLVSLNEAVKLFPNYFAALMLLGRQYIEKGMFSEAYPLLIKAVDVNPKSPTALYFLGYTLHKLNYNKAALVALTQAHNSSPASVMVLTRLGIVEKMEGKYVEAEKHLTQAKKLTKGANADLHWELAQLYGENLKKYDLAADELEEFLKAKPDAQDSVKIKEMIKKLREKAKAQASSN